MKKIYVLLLLALFLSNCNEDSPEEFNPYVSDPNLLQVDPSVNNFVWRAMNKWYVWQKNVPNLDDTIEKGGKEYYSYIDGYKTPKDLFNSLLFRKGVVDRFSRIIEDYDVHGERLSGLYMSFGFKSEKVSASNGVKVMVIKKVSKNSPADEQQLKRGDFIIGINGRKFFDGDYDQIIKEEYKKTSVMFMIGKLDGKTILRKVSLEKRKVNNDGIQYSNIYKAGDKTVGYLVYNGFWTKNNDQLNQVFANFKNSPNKITDIVLDLRYNGGGSIAVASYLASLIYGEGTPKSKFATLLSNKKVKEKTNYNFTDEITQKDKGPIKLNRLTGISTLYILTSYNTASASEMMINCLQPYMNVKLIGTKTRGKFNGSVTLYDSPYHNYRSKAHANKEHKYALQPLTFTIYNSQMKTGHTGFTPGIVIDEFKYLQGLKPFGDENETLLKAALNDIKGLSPRGILEDRGDEIIEHESLEENPIGNQAYIGSDDFENLEGF